LVNVDRNAGTFADRADTDVIEVDVSGDLVRIVGVTAEEGGHAP
jgi:hypothetical protein